MNAPETGIPEHFQPIENIFLGLEKYDCFVCSPSHVFGFRQKFYHDPAQECVAAPIPSVREEMAGYPGILHGGFQAMILDETMAWAALHYHNQLVFTAKMEMKFVGSVPTNKAAMVMARVVKPGKRLVALEGWIESEGEERARATGTFYAPTSREFAAMAGLAETPERLRPYLR